MCDAALVLEVTPVLVNKARSVGADRWVDRLPSLVEAVTTEWGLTVGRVFDGGTEAWVAEVVGVDGDAGVLKLCLPRPAADDPWHHARREAAVLDWAGGRGCAELIRSDPDRGALLLERLGPSMFDLGLSYRRRSEGLAAVASDLWRPVDDGVPDLPTGGDKARWLTEFIERTWEELDRPCSAAAVEQALAAASSREHAAERARPVVVHGDIHQWNALQVRRSGQAPAGWKLVDPDGLVAEPEYDLGVILREDPEELELDLRAGDPGRAARWLAEQTGTDPHAIWEWGLVERVSTGLVAVQIDLQPLGREMLALADRLAVGGQPDLRSAGG